MIFKAAFHGTIVNGGSTAVPAHVETSNAMKKAIVAAFALCAAQAFAGRTKVSTDSRLIVYPEYPSQIERDYAYGVTVTQGDTTTNLVVYNHCEKSPLADRTHGGDVNRRFCEFAFSGDPVRVDIAVCEDVQSYKVFPARLNLQSSFDAENGVISVWLDTPHSFGIELNDYVKSILTVLVDEPENPADIPSPGDSDVLYISGWMDAPGANGVLAISNQCSEVYIAPGAVLNARLYLKKSGVRVHGRGMILDPFSDIFRYDQINNTNHGVLNVQATGVTVEDIKIVDAREFNYISYYMNTTFRNIKAFSSMMCTDGITFGSINGVVEGAWLYVGDNGLVVGQNGNCAGHFSDIAIGTSCKAVFPQGNNTGIVMENIDVFRADEGLIANVYNPGSSELSHKFFFKNLSGVDCALFPRFFAGANMGTLPKTFGFENVSIPQSTGSSTWQSIGKSGKALTFYDDSGKPWTTSNYVFSITNLWVAGSRSDGFPDTAINNPDRVSISVVNNLVAPKIPAVPNRTEVNWTCPWKRFIGSSLQRDVRLANPQTGAQTLAEPYPRANLLADRNATRSVWQRHPSWQVKLDATTFDPDDGARIYRTRDSKATNTGMYCDITDGFLRRGNGTYTLMFDSRVDITNEVNQLTIQAKLLSNEKSVTVSFTAPNDGEWHRYTTDIETSFDMEVTDLVGLHIRTPMNSASGIDYKNLSLTKGSPEPTLTTSDIPGYDWTNRVVTVSGLAAGTEVTLTINSSSGGAGGSPAGSGGVGGSPAVVSAIADSTGSASFNVPTTPGSLYEYSIETNGGDIASGSFLAGGWDASGSWFLTMPDGTGGAVETNGAWTEAPATTNATHFVSGESAEFALSADALAAGEGRLFHADAMVSYPLLGAFAALEGVFPTNDIAAVAPVENPDGGDALWAAFLGGEWRLLSGGAAPQANTDYVVRLEGDFADAASPRVRLSVSDDGGMTFATLSDVTTGAEWFAPSVAARSGLLSIKTQGPLSIASLRGTLSNSDVASAGGTGYASLADALASGGPVTLLTNTTWPTNAPVGTVAVNRDGYSILLPPNGVSVDGNSVVVSAGLCTLAGEGSLYVTFTDLAAIGIATVGRTPAQIAADLLENGANGIPKWENYVLGLDATLATALPYANIAAGTTANTVDVSLGGVTINELAGATVTYKVVAVEDLADFSNGGTESEATEPDETVSVSTADSDAKFFRIRITIDISETSLYPR